MEVQVIYYKLLHDKKMSDGHTIPHGQKLVLIKAEGEDMFFEFHNEDTKTLFWANENEVEYVDTETENLSDERVEELKNFTKGSFL